MAAKRLNSRANWPPHCDTTGSIGTGVATAGDITGMGVLDLLHLSADELERSGTGLSVRRPFVRLRQW
jgi:hypothetical protein